MTEREYQFYQINFINDWWIFIIITIKCRIIIWDDAHSINHRYTIDKKKRLH